MNRTPQILKWFRWAILALCAIYIAFVLPGFLIYIFMDPSTSSIELVKTVFDLSLWLAILIFLVVVVLRARRLSILATIVVVIFVLIYLPQFLPRTPEIDPNAPQLTIMTFNLKTTSDGITDAIGSANADIVALQELSLAGAAALAELLDVYPHQALHPQTVEINGQGILSRYPIVNDEYWEYPEVPYTMGHQRVEINFEGTPIVIYNTHPWPPLAWETGYDDESHRVVLLDIAERTFTEELPLILVGDFNMTDQFGEYELFVRRYTDSYRAAGDGVGYTFPNNKWSPLARLLRIDFIWHSDDFESVEARVWGQHGESDHSPVVAKLALKADS